MEKCVQLIKDAAGRNTISYHTMLDILKDCNLSLKEDQIAGIISKLSAEGINIISTNESLNGADEHDALESFVPANILINQRTMTIWNIMERLKYHEFNLQPCFQRHGDLWTVEQQSRLIESFMLKIPLPAFYFDASHDGQWNVIDGLQRLCAIQRFLVGCADKQNHDQESRKETLCGLQYFKDCNNLTFDQLPRQYIRRIKESQIIAYTVEKGTPDSVVFNIFQRINT